MEYVLKIAQTTPHIIGHVTNYAQEYFKYINTRIISEILRWLGTDTTINREEDVMADKRCGALHWSDACVPG